MRRNNTKTAVLALMVTVPFLTVGCSGWSQTERGAAVGAGAGAAVGAAVGAATGSTARGAIVGAAVGGVAGAVIGNEMDEQAEELAGDLEGADVTRIGEGIAVSFPSGLLFDFDSSELRPGARDDLRDLARSLQEYDGREVLIVGHTDATGAADYNQRLSVRRAESAASYLASQGFPRSRIETAGRGETEPIATNETDAGRQQNRRVEVAIFATQEYREEVQRREGQ